MFFAFVCLFAFGWLAWSLYLIGAEQRVHPVVYFLAVLSWVIAILPTAYRSSFGG